MPVKLYPWYSFTGSNGVFTCITKGGFFYHFDGKTELAVGLMNRYRVNDRVFFEGLFAKASELVEDPLQQMLLFLKLLAEAFRNLPDVHQTAWHIRVNVHVVIVNPSLTF